MNNKTLTITMLYDFEGMKTFEYFRKNKIDRVQAIEKFKTHFDFSPKVEKEILELFDKYEINNPEQEKQSPTIYPF